MSPLRRRDGWTAPVQGLGRFLSRWSDRLVPDPFVLAILLTALAFGLALVFFQASDASSPGGQLSASERLVVLLDGWRLSFFDGGLLRFAFQMCLVLVTGHALATAPPVQRFVTRLSRIPKSTAQATVVVSLTAVTAGVVHWGLGAVVGAFLAREIGRASLREGRPLHYPILGASAYMGLLVWHGGLSGSAPLKMAEHDHFLVALTGSIPTSETLFSSYNLLVTGVLVTLVPAACWLLAPRAPDRFEPFVEMGEAVALPAAGDSKSSLAGWLEHSPALSLAMGALGLAWLGSWFAVVVIDTGRLPLDLDTVNFLFLFVGILLQRTPRRYVEAAVEGARGCAGIIVQFPFYFGILGLLKASGLIAAFASALVDLATAHTLPLWTFVSAGVVNLFVPSGGGQWAVQGEIVVEAATQLGANLHHTIMAFCYGDQLTNMLQPFWALPLLGITGLKARQIIGYTGAVMLIVTPVLVALLLLLR